MNIAGEDISLFAAGAAETFQHLNRELSTHFNGAGPGLDFGDDDLDCSSARYENNESSRESRGTRDGRRSRGAADRSTPAVDPGHLMFLAASSPSGDPLGAMLAHGGGGVPSGGGGLHDTAGRAWPSTGDDRTQRKAAASKRRRTRPRQAAAGSAARSATAVMPTTPTQLSMVPGMQMAPGPSGGGPYGGMLMPVDGCWALGGGGLAGGGVPFGAALPDVLGALSDSRDGSFHELLAPGVGLPFGSAGGSGVGLNLLTPSSTPDLGLVGGGTALRLGGSCWRPAQAVDMVAGAGRHLGGLNPGMQEDGFGFLLGQHGPMPTADRGIDSTRASHGSGENSPGRESEEDDAGFESIKSLLRWDSNSEIPEMSLGLDHGGQSNAIRETDLNYLAASTFNAFEPSLQHHDGPSNSSGFMGSASSSDSSPVPESEVGRGRNPHNMLSKHADSNQTSATHPSDPTSQHNVGIGCDTYSALRVPSEHVVACATDSHRAAGSSAPCGEVSAVSLGQAHLVTSHWATTRLPGAGGCGGGAAKVLEINDLVRQNQALRAQVAQAQAAREREEAESGRMLETLQFLMNSMRQKAHG
ncbi:hypothetical protein HK405_008633 [Cladochytrium tenue]|nr:hypothetical protein HK405_008633 [Cladochytrium tenue]